MYSSKALCSDVDTDHPISITLKKIQLAVCNKIRPFQILFLFSLVGFQVIHSLSSRASLWRDTCTYLL